MGFEPIFLIVEDILRHNPNHPGAHHASIHNWDSSFPEQALKSCAGYAKSSPGSGHALHMPGHTPGLVCLYERARRLVFSDDHLLERISPNPLIDLGPDGRDGFFRPLVAYLASVPNVLVVPARSPYKSVQDVVAAARKTPGKLTFASAGNGSSQHVAAAIFGLAPAASGEILVGGRPVRIASPADALAHGIAMVTEDRKEFGVVPGMSVRGNITLAALSRCCRGPIIDHGAEAALAHEQIDRFHIRSAGQETEVRWLSGGNQQKVVVAKALLCEPSILILDEPTRGIDVGAKAEVHALMSRLAQQGLAIVMISSELPEVLGMSDRVLVMSRGRMVASFDRAQATPDAVGAAMTRAAQERGTP